MDIEFHVLAYKPNKVKLERCLKSFETKKIPFVLSPTQDSIAVSRNRMYQNCKAEFCSYVDDDDEILIEKRAISRLLNNYTNKPIFTNSEIYLEQKLIRLLNSQDEVYWSLDKEVSGTIKTHPLMIFKTEFMQRLSLQVLNFLVSKKLDLNLFDYFVRTYVSLSSGWHYENCAAYRYHLDDGFTMLSRTTKTVPYEYQLRILRNKSSQVSEQMITTFSNFYYSSIATRSNRV